jgi:hypothetical protein
MTEWETLRNKDLFNLFHIRKRRLLSICDGHDVTMIMFWLPCVVLYVGTTIGAGNVLLNYCKGYMASGGTIVGHLSIR